MPSAYNKFQIFTKDLASGVHNFATHTFKVALTNVAPDPAANQVLADITQIATANGYLAGGRTTTASVATVGGVATVSGTPVVFTAAGGSMAAMRYAVLYNASAAGSPLISYWDYGAPLIVNDTETLTVTPDPTGVFDVT